MDYQLFDRYQQREAIRRELHNIETQHFAAVLAKLAIPDDRGQQNAQATNLARLERAAGLLRDELGRYDDLDAATPAPGTPPPVVRNALGVVDTAPPAPPSVVTASSGETVSEPAKPGEPA